MPTSVYEKEGTLGTKVRATSMNGGGDDHDAFKDVDRFFEGDVKFMSPKTQNRLLPVESALKNHKKLGDESLNDTEGENPEGTRRAVEAKVLDDANERRFDGGDMGDGDAHGNGNESKYRSLKSLYTQVMNIFTPSTTNFVVNTDGSAFHSEHNQTDTVHEPTESPQHAKTITVANKEDSFPIPNKLPLFMQSSNEEILGDHDEDLRKGHKSLSLEHNGLSDHNNESILTTDTTSTNKDHTFVVSSQSQSQQFSPKLKLNRPQSTQSQSNIELESQASNPLKKMPSNESVSIVVPSSDMNNPSSRHNSFTTSIFAAPFENHDKVGVNANENAVEDNSNKKHESISNFVKSGAASLVSKFLRVKSPSKDSNKTSKTLDTLGFKDAAKTRNFKREKQKKRKKVGAKLKNQRLVDSDTEHDGTGDEEFDEDSDLADYSFSNISFKKDSPAPTTLENKGGFRKFSRDNIKSLTQNASCDSNVSKEQAADVDVSSGFDAALIDGGKLFEYEPEANQIRQDPHGKPNIPKPLAKPKINKTKTQEIERHRVSKLEKMKNLKHQLSVENNKKMAFGQKAEITPQSNKYSWLKSNKGDGSKSETKGIDVADKEDVSEYEEHDEIDELFDDSGSSDGEDASTIDQKDDSINQETQYSWMNVERKRLNSSSSSSRRKRNNQPAKPKKRVNGNMLEKDAKGAQLSGEKKKHRGDPQTTSKSKRPAKYSEGSLLFSSVNKKQAKYHSIKPIPAEIIDLTSSDDEKACEVEPKKHTDSIRIPSQPQPNTQKSNLLEELRGSKDENMRTANTPSSSRLKPENAGTKADAVLGAGEDHAKSQNRKDGNNALGMGFETQVQNDVLDGMLDFFEDEYDESIVVMGNSNEVMEEHEKQDTADKQSTFSTSTTPENVNGPQGNKNQTFFSSLPPEQNKLFVSSDESDSDTSVVIEKYTHDVFKSSSQIDEVTSQNGSKSDLSSSAELCRSNRLDLEHKEQETKDESVTERTGESTHAGSDQDDTNTLNEKVARRSLAPARSIPAKQGLKEEENAQQRIQEELRKLDEQEMELARKRKMLKDALLQRKTPSSEIVYEIVSDPDDENATNDEDESPVKPARQKKHRKVIESPDSTQEQLWVANDENSPRHDKIDELVLKKNDKIKRSLSPARGSSRKKRKNKKTDNSVDHILKELAFSNPGSKNRDFNENLPEEMCVEDDSRRTRSRSETQKRKEFDSNSSRLYHKQKKKDKKREKRRRRIEAARS